MTTSGVIKIVVAFAAGAGLGVLGSARHFKLKYEKVAQEDIEKIRSYYASKDIPRREGYVKSSESEVDKNVADFEKKTEREYVDYTQYQYSAEPEPRENVIQRLAEEESPMEEEVRRKKVKNGPKPLKPEMFGTDPRLEPVVLHYYPEEDMITDDEDTPYDPDRAYMMVGDWLDRFGFANPDNRDDELYIRNELHGCDYKIIKMSSNYSG